MADRRAGEGIPHVPSKGGVQPRGHTRGRNKDGRWRKKRSDVEQGSGAPREINASPSEKAYWSMQNSFTTDSTVTGQGLMAKIVQLLDVPLARSRQVFRDTSREQVRPMKQEEDPALAPFLQVLDNHISAHPEQLQPMTMDLVARLDDLVGAVDVDLNAPLEAGDEDEDHATL